jgi:hypothetical protein
VKTGAAYLLVLVLAVELTVAECFLVGARPFGHPIPVAAALAAAANPLLGYAGGRVLRRPAGAIVPGVVWFVVVLMLGVTRPEGDLVVNAGLRGNALLAVGAIAVVIGAVLGATPGARTGR